MTQKTEIKPETGNRQKIQCRQLQGKKKQRSFKGNREIQLLVKELRSLHVED